MNRSTRCWIGLLLSLCLFEKATAQGIEGLIAPSDANRFGLQRMWFTQIEVDVARGRVVHLTQHVSATETITVYEVLFEGGKFEYRETDLDKFGRVLGRDEAKKLAEVKLADLKAMQIEAKPAIQLVPRITLYAVTDSGLIQAIDAETGRTRWKTAVGNSQYITEAIGANDKFVAAINGSEIYLLNAENGEVVWQRKVKGAPGAGAAVTENLVFVPMTNGAMEAYSISEPRTPPAIFRSHGRAMIQPTYTGSNVAWPTDRGHLYVSSADSNRINFRLEANASIVTPACYFPPNRIITSSIDGFVYCLHESSGTLLWRFSAGEPIVAIPVPYGDSVYPVTEDGTLFAVDGEIGVERWSTTRMSQVVGASRERLYCLSDIGRLTILDRRTGTRLGSLSTELDDLPFINRETDRIIIGTTSGLLQCYRESTSNYPLIHIVLSKPEEPAPKKPLRRQPSETPKEGTTDPFGGSSDTPAPMTDPGADPFAGETMPEEAPPAEAKTEENPFG